MFPSSLAVALTGLVLGALAIAAFLLAWRRGHFHHLDAQARSILDERDWRLERPWEGPMQRAERADRHGPLVPAAPGEWGGAE